MRLKTKPRTEMRIMPALTLSWTTTVVSSVPFETEEAGLNSIKGLLALVGGRADEGFCVGISLSLLLLLVTVAFGVNAGTTSVGVLSLFSTSS